jgi:hypothetical protein
MSGLGLWNLDKKPDKAERPNISRLGTNMSEIGLWNPDKAERLNMSGMGVGHVWPQPLESGLGVGYVWPNRRFWW